jgi:hypothetical protein
LEEVREFNAGVSWWDAEFAQRVRANAARPELAVAARDLIARMESANKAWFWKDPALCHFLGFWKKFWEAPVFVLTVRHPVDIAVSWQRMVSATHLAPASVDVNLERWHHMAVTALHETAGSPRIVMVYESIVDDPLAQALRLARFLDAQFGNETTEPTIQSMAAACDPTLWRNHTQIADARGALSAGQRDVYSAQLDAAMELDGMKRHLPSPTDGWRERIRRAEFTAESSGSRGGTRMRL